MWPNEVEIKSKFQIQAKYLNKKTLVVGCGREIERGFTSATMPNLTCSMNRDHKHDILLDIDDRSKPDVTMDFGLWEQYSLHIIASRHFKRIEFEYICKGMENFTDTEIFNWLNGADKMLDSGGEIVFISGCDSYIERAFTYLLKRGNYKMLNRGNTPQTLKAADGKYFKDKNGVLQEHKYCLAKKKN